MGATINRDRSGIWVLRVRDALQKEELDAALTECLKTSGAHDDLNLLVIVENDFIGWMGREVWNDMTFFVRHGDRVAKIAIVGDPKWESRMLMFTGAGFRRAPVKYFAENQLSQAYDWLG
ncbi:MAG TPA: STAS/SEC14 domain-containing protein [Geomonas sp.]|nr:STAS/SEC14 domain-containing protein [Geomonas sp.]